MSPSDEAILRECVAGIQVLTARVEERLDGFMSRQDERHKENQDAMQRSRDEIIKMQALYSGLFPRMMTIEEELASIRKSGCRPEFEAQVVRWRESIDKRLDNLEAFRESFRKREATGEKKLFGKLPVTTAIWIAIAVLFGLVLGVPPEAFESAISALMRLFTGL